MLVFLPGLQIEISSLGPWVDHVTHTEVLEASSGITRRHGVFGPASYIPFPGGGHFY